MSPLPTPRRLLTLDALSARARPARISFHDDAPDTRMPDEADALMLQALASARLGRLAAEVALEEGGRRAYATRGESQVLEAGRR